MNGLKFLKWACSILLLSILSTSSIQPASTDSDKFFSNDIQDNNDGGLLNFLLQADFSQDIHILLPERDTRKNISKNNFFLAKIISYSGRPILTAPTLKRYALLIPAMNSRTLIYPFHSFL